MTDRRHLIKLLLLWLGLSAALCAFLFSASWSALEAAVEPALQEHLVLTLDEAHFSRSNNRLSDHETLARIGARINLSLQDWVEPRWYSPWHACVVQLQRVDDIELAQYLGGSTISFSLPRNQIERQIELGLNCQPDWQVAFAVVLLFSVPFWLLAWLLPPPLSRGHRYWINYLLERGHEGQQAFDLVSTYEASELELNAAQREAARQLHGEEGRDFRQVLGLIIDPGVASLTTQQVPWLVLGLRVYDSDLDKALSLATGDDRLTINLDLWEVRIRDLQVPMGRTPLFYYAWYALHRIRGDGWVSNPASNRPDEAAGAELARLMEAHEGHARAINDLTQHGLKARTLDQNRSKIKEELVAVLGEELAAGYLFDAQKHEDDVQMQYRLCLKPDQIKVIDATVDAR